MITNPSKVYHLNLPCKRRDFVESKSQTTIYYIYVWLVTKSKRYPPTRLGTEKTNGRHTFEVMISRSPRLPNSHVTDRSMSSEIRCRTVNDRLTSTRSTHWRDVEPRNKHILLLLMYRISQQRSQFSIMYILGYCHELFLIWEFTTESNDVSSPTESVYVKPRVRRGQVEGKREWERRDPNVRDYF